MNLDTLEEFYKTHYNDIPDSIYKDSGQFSVFRLEPFLGDNARPLSYRRSDYFKISLAIGSGTIHYADKSQKIKKQALVFSDPNIPYTWEETNDVKQGYFCIFTPKFYFQFDNANKYPIFQPNGNHVFELNDKGLKLAVNIFDEMMADVNLDYLYKYDLLHNHVFRLIHLALKTTPNATIKAKIPNRQQHITSIFFDLLERQFPIDEHHSNLEIHTASDFADKLNIHVNYLNRAVKNTTNKTTLQIINERIFQEAKILLKQTQWSVSDIAFALSFKEVSHFNNFFKRYSKVSPLAFRNA